MKDGRLVTSPAMWQARRREIVEDFDREVFGRVPAAVPNVTWSVARVVEATVAGRAAIGRQLRGHVDNSAYPAIEVDILMTLVTPRDARAPVPVVIMFRGGAGLPGDPSTGNTSSRGPTAFSSEVLTRRPLARR